MNGTGVTTMIMGVLKVTIRAPKAACCLRHE